MNELTKMQRCVVGRGFFEQVAIEDVPVDQYLKISLYLVCLIVGISEEESTTMEN